MKTPLPSLAPVPVTDLRSWRYPARFGRGWGVCRLRVWDVPEVVGHVAVVTELDDNPGPSVTNSAEDIVPLLGVSWPGPLVVFEHYPADPASTLRWARKGRVDWVRLTDAGPVWKPVWPVHPDHPDFAVHALWAQVYGPQILDPAYVAGC